MPGTQKGKNSRTNDSIKELCLIRRCFFFSPQVKHSSIFNSCIRGSPRFQESKENISTWDDLERHCCPTSVFAGRSVCPRQPAVFDPKKKKKKIRSKTAFKHHQQFEKKKKRNRTIILEVITPLTCLLSLFNVRLFS